MPDYFDMMRGSAASPSQSELQDQRRRMNQQPSITAAQAAADAANAQPPIGTVLQHAGHGDSSDGRWLICDGRLREIISYPELYEEIGTIWNKGDEPAGFFRIPDTRGRAPIGAGQGDLLSDRPLASKVGAETHTLTADQLAAHEHGYTSEYTHSHGGATGINSHNHGGDDYIGSFNTITGLAGGGTGVALYSQNYALGTVSTIDHNHGIGENTHNHYVGSAGSGVAHNNMPPSLALNLRIRALI